MVEASDPSLSKEGSFPLFGRFDELIDKRAVGAHIISCDAMQLEKKEKKHYQQNKS